MSDGLPHAVRWRWVPPSGQTPGQWQIDDIASQFAGHSSRAYAVHAGAQAVGSAEFDVGGGTWQLRGFRHAMIGSNGETVPLTAAAQLLPLQSGNTNLRTEAFSIAASGATVGYYEMPASPTPRKLATLWPANANTPIFVGVLTHVSGAYSVSDSESLARGINDAHEIVGTSRYVDLSGNMVSRAFYCQAIGDLPRDLNNRHWVHNLTGWTLTEAVSIGNSGTIAGIGIFNGKPRGFLLRKLL